MSRTGDRFRAACITVLGSGHAPIASGSWGALVAVLLFVPVWWLGHSVGPRWIVEAVTVVGVFGASWLSVRWGPWAIARYGRSDPKQFTLDEFAGQWVTLLWLPVAWDADARLLACVLATHFLLFRMLDILKPPPARQCEQLPAGWGILVDDLFAGLYANLVGQLLWRGTPVAELAGRVLRPALDGS